MPKIDKIIKESLREFLSKRNLLNEMAYSPKDYCHQCAVQSGIVYLHLGKLFLYGDSTRNAEDWINQTVDRHLLNMVTAKYTASARSKEAMFRKGYLDLNFGKDLEDYDERMAYFCQIAEIEVMEGSIRLYSKEAKPINDIEDAVRNGKAVIIGIMQKAADLLQSNNVGEARAILKDTLKRLLAQQFNMQF